MVAASPNPLHLVGDEDSSKRRQILDGARKVFMDLGFDGASMNEIARSAGVSKGTLYVYFADKNRLFEAIVEEEALDHGQVVFNFDPARDVATTLREFGKAYIRTAVPAGRRLRHPHRDGDRRADARRRPPLLRTRAGKNHQPPRRLSARRMSRRAILRSPTASSRHRNSWKYARRRCSCRSCFRPPPPLRPSASNEVVESATQMFLAAYRAKPA